MLVTILIHRNFVGDHLWPTKEIKGVSGDSLKLAGVGEKMRKEDSGKFSTYWLRVYDTDSGEMHSEVEIKPSSANS
jgi:hypothetical protein